MSNKRYDEYFYKISCFPERLYKSSKDNAGGPKDPQMYKLMHNHKNCRNGNCLMNSHLFKYTSTIGASSAPVEHSEAAVSTCLFNVMLRSPPKLIDDIVFAPLTRRGLFPLILDADVERSIEKGDKKVTVTLDQCDFVMLPLNSETKELVRHALFCQSIKPLLEHRGFIVQQEMTTYIDTFDPFSQYGSSAIDISFYKDNYFSKGNAVVGGIVVTRSKPIPVDRINVEAEGIELKRGYRSPAKSQVQAEAECFLIASNVVALALQNHCCVVNKVTSYVALVDMDKNMARVVKLEISFRDDGGSANFTISTPAPINDVVSRIVFHLETWNI